jgi:hypothetical protein
VHTQFQEGVDISNGRILLFDHSRQVATITIKDGRTTSIIARLLNKMKDVEYNMFLKQIGQILGNRITFNIELDRLGRYLFGPLLGVFPRDKQPAKHGKNYYIVNLDNSNQPGSHWVAVAGNLVYDSFGRDLGFRMQRTEDDAEQENWEVNCGQRCLAFLCVYHRYGAQKAKLILKKWQTNSL